ncbi:FAD-linked oxidase-like protein [Crucibulum laeve]|uniref:D-lactate dehydrogenase (cytochrome) n=1 Tax=Crucibulum laeve TaxID=68775 RepID=A0A5C3LK18_9AGAR|nr:FAD-linked oxidase-like protein [Crucibulum laeve]
MPRRLYSNRGDNAAHAAPNSSTSRRRFLGFGALLTSAASGLLGYTIAKSSEKPSAFTTVNNDTVMYGSPEDFRQAIADLKTALPEKDAVSTDANDLHTHGFSEHDYHPTSLHTVIVYPKSTEDVVKIVKIANKFRMPLVAYSGATSLEGHYRGHELGGICVDLNHMDRILEIHEADSDLVCQPAARWLDINETLKENGIPLFFPNKANAVRYGTAKGEWFLNATVVLPSGEVIKTRTRSRKSSAGFDVTKLFVGAEGTLGIVTEVTIRLAPLLPTTVAVVHFPDVCAATEAVIDVMNQGVGIQCVELLDDLFMAATNKYGVSKRKWPEKDSLFFKLQGPTEASILETVKVVKKVIEKHGESRFTLAQDKEEAADLWADQKYMLFPGLALVKGSSGSLSVLVLNLPKLVYETKKDVAESGLVCTIVGHVGDGNFHALLLFKNDEEFAKVNEVTHRMVKRALALDGTCSGEHGIGMGKKKYLVEELGIGTVELMKTIKKAIDPLALFNPGKLYPDTPPRSKVDSFQKS